MDFVTSRRIRVGGDSMLPTFQPGDKAIVSPREYKLGSPDRFDVVILKSVDGRPAEIKRIVGLPGEEVMVRNKQLVIDGEDVDQPVDGSDSGTHLWVLQSDEFIVLGDNRRVSVDSRKYGPVRKDQILGPIVRRM
ncbi:MAG: signal peptidase I [Chloroflexi bacterium]|nr:signal peptidase I [Chloroflexota bacterium]